MAKNTTSLEQLKSFLNQLFQFDSQDLDFGVYKILHYKKNEIANFIDQLLVDKVKTALQTLSADEVKQVQRQIAKMEKSTSLKKWLEAVEKNDENRLDIYEEDYKNEITQYKELKAKAAESTVSVETENQIYNHLTLFFSRYYDKGDFISKRRFGKNEKYVVPYNGEETHFHWANQDQYYIKSSETFNQYAFKVPSHIGEVVINFKLTEAQVEQGNVKENDTNYFILSEKNANINEKEAHFFFEYRPLTTEEKKQVKTRNKQDTLDEIAFDFLKKEFGTNPIFANLWKEQEEKPLLLKKLQHYTRKNKHDFFIHKNLKGFLERELDYYIKSELVNVDDLYVTDTDSHFDRLKHNLKTIKVFKSIADTIIAFVSQIEDFQKKLWEKKKFVLSTEWVITIDRLVEYVGEKATKPILEEVIKNERQVVEWEELFGVTDIGKHPEWKKLPIDTQYFSSEFKYELLNTLSSKVDIKEKSDGLVINTDNYQGLIVLEKCFNQKISCVYIDPPYNTEKDRSTGKFIYKDGFSESTWLTFLDERIKHVKPLLDITDGSIYCSIDDNQQATLELLLDKHFSRNNLMGNLIWSHGRTSSSHYTQAHEYILSYAVDKEKKPLFSYEGDSVISDRAIKKPGTKNPASEIRFPAGMDFECDDKVFPNKFGKEEPVEVIEGIFEAKDGKLANDVILKAGWTMKDMIEKWIRGESVKDSKGQIVNRFFFKSNGVLQYEKIKGTIHPRTIIEGKTTKQGSNMLRALFNSDPFEFPKPPSLIADIISTNTSSESSSLVLDFFPGSGTTFHATQIANKSGKKVKCILTEMGNYTYSIIIPRIKKVAYTFDWKDGKPKDGSMNGLGVFFKYQRLEQYEEALENIAFNASEDAAQKALEFEQYIPKYFLEFETKGSQTLVNTAAMKDPWDYKLKVWDGFTYDTEQAVDLVETFNYLIGLHMQKCITKELNGKKYQFIYGHNNANKNILVVWRSVKDWSVDDFKADASTIKTELKAFEYDLLYINDQAHIESYQPIEEVFKNKMLS